MRHWACFEPDVVHMQLPRRQAMNEMRELTDTEVESVCGGISDLGKYITKAVDDAISAAVGGNSGVDPGMTPGAQPKGYPL